MKKLTSNSELTLYDLGITIVLGLAIVGYVIIHLAKQ